jgi:hypothetical protein
MDTHPAPSITPQTAVKAHESAKNDPSYGLTPPMKCSPQSSWNGFEHIRRRRNGKGKRSHYCQSGESLQSAGIPICAGGISGWRSSRFSRLHQVWPPNIRAIKNPPRLSVFLRTEAWQVCWRNNTRVDGVVNRSFFSQGKVYRARFMRSPTKFGQHRPPGRLRPAVARV